MILSTQLKRKLNQVCCLLVALFCSQAQADVSLPSDPSESIRYWKEYVIDPESNPSVALTEQVYQQMLAAWDNSRITPKVYVVKAQRQPWAASLADGSILVSLPAVKLALKSGEDRGRHLLAFILAHELAHQRNDDMWHTKFLQLAASLNSSQSNTISLTKRSENEDNRITEEKEVRADREALAMMAIVGFDPLTVIDANDFFTIWVESVRGQSCRSKTKPIETARLCEEAKARALRAKARIVEQATQSMLFTVGVQLFVAGQYAQAREFFQAFGYEFPFQAVHSNIGLSYVSEAVKIDQYLRQHAVVTEPLPVFPFILQTLKQVTGATDTALFRSGKVTKLTPEQVKRLRQQYYKLMDAGINAFQQALKVNADSPQVYHFIIASHINAGNYLTAKAFLHERYARRFGKDLWFEFYTAQLTLLDGDLMLAKKQLATLQEKLEALKTDNSRNLLHLVYQSYVALLKSENVTDELEDFVNKNQLLKQSNSRFALLSVAPEFNDINVETQQGDFTNNQLSLWKQDAMAQKNGQSIAMVWLSGEPLQLLELQQSIRLIKTKEDHVAALWEFVSQTPSKFLQQLDLAFKQNKLGQASRVIQHQKGYYLAFDNYKIALNVQANQVKAWFSYPNFLPSKMAMEVSP